MRYTRPGLISAPRWRVAPMDSRDSYVSLRRATHLAKAAGCLLDDRTSSRLSPLCEDLLPSSRHTVEPSRTRWADIEMRQRSLFYERHSAASRTVGATTSCVNAAHLAVYVHTVRCGHPASHGPGSTNDGIPGRRTVTLVASPPHGGLTLQLAVSIDSPALLAVRCALSRGVVDACWRESCRVKRPGHSHGNVADAGVARGDDRTAATEIKASADQTGQDVLQLEKMRCVKAWAEQLVLHKWVVLSGQLRMEDVYDGDLDMVVPVPVLELPPDAFKASITVIPLMSRETN